MNKLFTFVALTGLAVAGCTLAPKYQRPAAPVSQSWPDHAMAGATNNSTNAAADIGWREFFNDPRLQQLVGLALTNNRDLRMAVLNVELSQARYRVTRATLVPQVNATGSYVRQRSPGYLLFPGESAVMKVTTDFIPTLTARVGYAVDHVLLYGKGGAAWAYNKYSLIGTFNGTPFDAEGLSIKTGWTVGAGVEWAFAEDWSARLEYDYYDFGNQTVTMSHTDPAGVTSFTGPMSYKQTAQAVKLGVNFRVPGWQ